jgi:hypothetical protein
MTAPDVVYVVRPGERNEELRYSLRSLSNLPHGKVWISGYCPKWVTGVGVIPTQTKPGGHQHAKANLRAACEHPEVSEQFVYMNDDFFVMQPMDELPVMHRGPLADLVRSGMMASAYTGALRRTLAILKEQGIAEPLMYDLHAPMLVTKAGMLKALDLCQKPQCQERTLFGNLQRVGGELHRNHKVGRTHRGWQTWPFLSTNDNTFRSLPVGGYIRGRFPEGSPYELAGTSTWTTPTSDRAPTTPRRPVRYHSVGAKVRVAA